MRLFSWISSLFTGKGSTNGKVDTTVPTDSSIDPIVIVEAEHPRVTKDTSRFAVKQELEQSSNDLHRKRDTADEKLREIDVLLSKRIEEKKGGAYGIC